MHIENIHYIDKKKRVHNLDNLVIIDTISVGQNVKPYCSVASKTPEYINQYS